MHQLTAPFNSSAGRVIYKYPVKFYAGRSKKLVTFSTNFSFSISSGDGNEDGLAFVVVSDDVEFDTLMDDKYGDVNGNHVGIDLSSFVSLKVKNLSSLNLGLNSGEKLQAWIDYELNSRRLEVRNSSQLCNVYSWSFNTRRSPDWMHSEPLDPISFKEREENEVKDHKRSDCVMGILSALILGVGLGALGSFIGIFLWTIFGKRQPILPEVYAAAAAKPTVLDKAASANVK
ncbi:hypothetical protein QVD17_21189 [Tagetes erecta]|uniref:Legume lectin domain-containing protein n=1 Tax=Tagetes erecta TaxID=13708 RepID=A0AAD8KQJ3_TARER|nr:hypothetical protein QVD17_21189 [Tagetes erecta]